MGAMIEMKHPSKRPMARQTAMRAPKALEVDLLHTGQIVSNAAKEKPSNS